MNTVSNILLPSQMCPELAQVISEKLNWAPNNSARVHYLSLAILSVSWQMDKLASLEEYQQRLRGMFAGASDNLLSVMSDEAFYVEMAKQRNIGPLIQVQAQQAAASWAQLLKDENLASLHLHADALLAAAVTDTSPSSVHLANEIEDVIEALCVPEEEIPPMMLPQGARGGVMLVHPVTGQHYGPFASNQEAMAFIAQDVQKSLSGMMQPPAVDNSAATVEEDTGPSMPIYQPGDAVTLLQRMPAPMPNEGNAQQRRVLEMMARDSGRRKMTMVPEGKPLAELYESFPHFKEVLDFISRRFALAACGEEGKPARLPPILLRGEPGTGKTFFALELARILGAHCESRDLNTTSEAWVLSGMDSSWKNSKPGIVFDSVVNGKTANPVICLNEVEKAAARGGNNSPLEALYALLEPATSRQFKDEFVPIAIDASRVLWVLTANEGELPEPILTRVELFNIPLPTQEQCRTIAKSVWKNICAHTLPQGHPFSLELGEPMLDLMSRMSPRVMKKALTDAASVAVYDGRGYLMPGDLTSAQKRYTTPERRSMGFVQAA